MKKYCSTCTFWFPFPETQQLRCCYSKGLCSKDKEKIVQRGYYDTCKQWEHIALITALERYSGGGLVNGQRDSR